MLRFSYQNLRRNPSDTLFFAGAIWITSAIVTIFFCIIKNPYYVDSTYRMPGGFPGITYYNPSNDGLLQAFDMGIGNGIFTIMLSILMIAICIMSIFYSHTYYLTAKSKDIGIMLLSGCTVKKLIDFLIVQNILIVMVVTPMGIPIGLLVTPFLNKMIYAQMAIDASTFVLTLEMVGYPLIIMSLVSIWLVILDYGFVIRSASLLELMKEQKAMKGRKHKPMLLRCLYVAVYLTSIGFILYYPIEHVNMIFMGYLATFIYIGAVNVFRYVLPELLAYIQRTYFYAHKHLLLSLANLQYSLANSSQLITMILLSTSILYYYLCRFLEDKATWLVILFTYIVVLLLIITCIAYKLCNDVNAKQPIYQRMLCVGFLKRDIQQVILQEVFGFYSMILLVALPPLLTILYIYKIADVISIGFLLALLGSFILALAFGGWMMYHLYQKWILHGDKAST